MPTNVQSRKANYVVKGVETVVAGRDIQARIFTLAPGEIIPWHSHSEITDYFFVLSGRLIVETRAPDARVTPNRGSDGNQCRKAEIYCRARRRGYRLAACGARPAGGDETHWRSVRL